MDEIKKAFFALDSALKNKDALRQNASLRACCKALSKHAYFMPAYKETLDFKEFYLLSEQDRGKAFRMCLANHNGKRAYIACIDQDAYDVWLSRVPHPEQIGILKGNWKQCFSLYYDGLLQDFAIDGIVLNPADKGNLFLSPLIIEMVCKFAKINGTQRMYYDA